MIKWSMKNNGLIHIYTGDGKGKTTAAIGLATRALGHGQKVCYCSFCKDPEKYGYNEMQSLRKLGAEVFNFAKGHPHLNRSLDENVIRQETHEAVAKIKNEFFAAGYDLMILDELNISVRDNYLEEELLLDLIKSKPATLELVITGRGATDAVMELADYVSEIKKIKHPYDQKIRSREGIEF
jgi:cob(I)alamin adenosyltransferase